MGPTTLGGLQEPAQPRIVPGLERPGTLSLACQATTFPGLQEPWEPRIEGALGTLCTQGRPFALVTLRNGQNGSFPAFPAFLAVFDGFRRP